MKKNIAVLCGGYSSEAEISMKTGRAVANWISEYEDYHPIVVEIRSDGWWAWIDGDRVAINRDDFSAGHINFQAAVNAIHGTPGEDGKIAAYLELIHIPFTGCGSFASALTFDKGWCNSVLKQLGFKVAEHLIYTSSNPWTSEEVGSKLGWPVFVKPCRAGSSFGISKVDGPETYDKAIELARAEDQRMIIEKGLQGTEVTCGVYTYQGEIMAFPLTEIVSHNDYFDYAAKYLGQSEEITPARVSDALREEVQETARAVYANLELSGLCRIDFIIAQGAPHIIEVNTVPGLTNESIIPQQARCAGVRLSEVFMDQLEQVG